MLPIDLFFKGKNSKHVYLTVSFDYELDRINSVKDKFSLQVNQFPFENDRISFDLTLKDKETIKYSINKYEFTFYMDDHSQESRLFIGLLDLEASLMKNDSVVVSKTIFEHDDLPRKLTNPIQLGYDLSKPLKSWHSHFHHCDNVYNKLNVEYINRDEFGIYHLGDEESHLYNIYRNLLGFIPNEEGQDEYLEFLNHFKNKHCHEQPCQECKGKGYVDLFQFRYNCSLCSDGRRL